MAAFDTNCMLSLPGSFNRTFQRLGQHHHSRAAAVGSVIDGPVVIRRKITGVPRIKTTPALINGTTCNAMPRQRIKHFREQGEHHGPKGGAFLQGSTVHPVCFPAVRVVRVRFAAQKAG